MNTAVEGKPIALFNPLSIARQDPVTVRLPVSEIPENPTVKASDGTALPTDLRLCEDGKTAEITFLPLLPPLSMTVLALTKGEKTAASSSPPFGRGRLPRKRLSPGGAERKRRYFENLR